MSNTRIRIGRAAAATGAVLTALGLSISAASALPLGLTGGPDTAAQGSPLLQQVLVGEHRKYPGSNTDAAKAARAKRLAPNYFCDKQPSRCQ